MLRNQRRVERYKVIYNWKSLRKMVLDLGLKETPMNERLGWMIALPKVRGCERYKTLMEGSVKIEGANNSIAF